MGTGGQWRGETEEGNGGESMRAKAPRWQEGEKRAERARMKAEIEAKRKADEAAQKVVNLWMCNLSCCLLPCCYDVVPATFFMWRLTLHIETMCS